VLQKAPTQECLTGSSTSDATKEYVVVSVCGGFHLVASIFFAAVKPESQILFSCLDIGT